MEALVAITVLAAIAGLAVVVARGGLDGARFRVTVRGEGIEGVKVEGRVPGYGHDEVAAFVAELELPVGAKIRGIPQGDRVGLRFSDEVPPHRHQRLRNFFYLKQ